jgi:hypothetical protein
MDAIHSSETLALTRAIRCHIPKRAFVTEVVSFNSNTTPLCGHETYHSNRNRDNFTQVVQYWFGRMEFSFWGCTKPSNTKVLQRFRSNVLRCITNVPWYVWNLTLHRDLQIQLVTEKIKKYPTIYDSRLIQHENNQVTELSNLLHVKRKLRGQWPSDLIVEGEKEK